jgi:hypothetical protein
MYFVSVCTPVEHIDEARCEGHATGDDPGAIFLQCPSARYQDTAVKY